MEGLVPTADDHHRAALHLRRLGARLARDELVMRTASDPARIARGPLGAMIDRSLDLVCSDVARARAELERLATICERRAEVCARYETELRRHRQLPEAIGRWSTAPVPPAWWVEPGRDA
jgi:hypothetical protein